MSLYVCSSCKSIENTALGPYWGYASPQLCSACGRGMWHGRFPREKFDEKKWKYTDDSKRYVERIV